MRHIKQFTGDLDTENQRTLEECLQGKVCVFVSVVAIDWKQAIERGRKKIDQILHLIRAFFGTHTFYNLPASNLCVTINKTLPRTLGISNPIPD